MESIIIGIKNCKECPHFKTENQWSSDGWDRMEDWVCGKENKKIQGSVEWHEERHIQIPEWCPNKIKKDNNLGIDVDKLSEILNDEKFKYNMCLSYRHDFGLLPKEQQNSIMFDASEWVRLIINNLHHHK